MRLKNTLIWGIVLLLLAGFVYYYEVKGGRERQRIEDQAKHIFVFEEADFNQLELHYADTYIKCIKTDAGEWHIVKPIDYPGDDEAIKRLIDAVKGATAERKLDASDQALSAFGLAPPQLKLALTSKDKQYVLLLGNKNPMGSLMYAKREADAELFLLDSSLYNSLAQGVPDLRSERVISIPEVDVSQIELDYANRKLVLTNDPKVGWQITTPRELKADPDGVSTLIRQINSMRVKEFVAEETDTLARFGLDKPMLRLTLTNGRDQTQKRLLLGHINKEKQGIYAKRGKRPQVILLDSSIGTELTKEVFSIRERRILRFDTVRVNEVELSYPKSVIRLKKEAEEWQLVQPEKAPVKGYLVESMLYDLAYLKAAAFIEGTPKPDAAYGFDKPQVKATLKLVQGGNASTLSLSVGAITRQDDTSVYVKRDDGRVFLAPKEIVEQLSQKPADLKREIVKD